MVEYIVCCFTGHSFRRTSMLALKFRRGRIWTKEHTTSESVESSGTPVSTCGLSVRHPVRHTHC